MIKITDKRKCSGCSACADVCGHQCISMVRDEEGFAYPSVDANKCVECGLCERVCPIINVPSDNGIRRVYASKNKDTKTRLKSSSGGIFALLAREIIRGNGLVVGCHLDGDMKACHTIVDNENDLAGLLSSKYVQSDTEGIYREIKKQLKEGRTVLFSGVPCQVAALRNFLMRPYDNLITVDILCHGVPSPKIFKEYLASLELRYGGKVVGVNFRCKRKSWKRLYIEVRFDNGKKHFLFSGYDSYMQLFLADRTQRPSCFACPYNNLNRPGDISLGDFWGIGKVNYEFDDNKGISLVIINNEAGRTLWQKIAPKAINISSDIETAIEGNKVLVKHLATSERRDEFYSYYTAEGYDASIAHCAPEASCMKQFYYNSMRRGLDTLRKIKKESY